MFAEILQGISRENFRLAPARQRAMETRGYVIQTYTLESDGQELIHEQHLACASP